MKNWQHQLGNERKSSHFLSRVCLPSFIIISWNNIASDITSKLEMISRVHLGLEKVTKYLKGMERKVMTTTANVYRRKEKMEDTQRRHWDSWWKKTQRWWKNEKRKWRRESVKRESNASLLGLKDRDCLSLQDTNRVDSSLNLLSKVPSILPLVTRGNHRHHHLRRKKQESEGEGEVGEDDTRDTREREKDMRWKREAGKRIQHQQTTLRKHCYSLSMSIPRMKETFTFIQNRRDSSPWMLSRMRLLLMTGIKKKKREKTFERRQQLFYSLMLVMMIIISSMWLEGRDTWNSHVLTTRTGLTQSSVYVSSCSSCKTEEKESKMKMSWLLLLKSRK